MCRSSIRFLSLHDQSHPNKRLTQCIQADTPEQKKRFKFITESMRFRRIDNIILLVFSVTVQVQYIQYIPSLALAPENV